MDKATTPEPEKQNSFAGYAKTQPCKVCGVWPAPLPYGLLDARSDMCADHYRPPMDKATELAEDLVDRFLEHPKVKAYVAQAREQTAKAYGGCTKCYGKGYASHQTAHTGRHYYKKIDEMVYCTCERGKQLEAYVAQAREQAAREARRRILTMAIARFEKMDDGLDYLRQQLAQLQAPNRKQEQSK